MKTSVRISSNVPLAPLTTYKLGGPARWFTEPADLSELIQLAADFGSNPIPVLLLGRGSNLIVSDRGFEGLVIRLGSGFQTIDIGDEIVAGGAVSLPMLARASVKVGRLGLEFFVGIPGSVGGAVRMNAGCHGQETTAWLVAALVMDLRSGEAVERSPADLELSYRRSNLTDTEVVTSARFRAGSGPPGRGELEMRRVSRWRRDTQPGGTLNAGSVFKNPPGDHAGRIIDSLGLKGLTVGGARVSEKHANFFVAGPGASAGDVHALVQLIRRRVAEETGIVLETEVRFVGDFEE